jgi:hypothetical protein
MTGGKIALLVTGILLALFGFGTTVAGGGMLWTDGTQRGPDGYLTSPTYTLHSAGHAVTAEEIHLGGPSPDDWFPWFSRFEVRFDVASTGGAPVFVGVGSHSEVDGYLRDVRHDEAVRLGLLGAGDVRYRRVEGSTTPAPPATQGFWEASAHGAGRQQLTWVAAPGAWAIVVMNADASPGVSVEARAAAQAGFLRPLAIALLVGGLVLLAIGAAFIVGSTTGPATRPAAALAPQPVRATGAASEAPRYPVAVEARLDPALSRWLWLVKWLLLIPHAVALLFLWTAFTVLTIVAGFAILVTGRYPRGLFDFNVGVIRWTWRVTFYGYSALGTDRYPPFTLAATDYPATLEIAYPERLSRGLVLVKWWLLAIPHYIVVGLLVGGGLAWTTASERWGTWTIGGGTGIIGVLVFVAGLLLLVRARYPQGLFDIIMGLNRWVYRVVAYVALMTDEYPPFRLDLGGPEQPQPVPPPPTGGDPSTGAPPELVHR